MGDGGNIALIDLASPIMSYLSICVGVAQADCEKAFDERFKTLIICNLIITSYMFMTVKPDNRPTYIKNKN